MQGGASLSCRGWFARPAKACYHFTMRPKIGISPDEGFTTASPGRPALPRFELKQAYAQAVLDAGGLPLVLPYGEDGAVAEYLDAIDGLVVTGGAFDIDPEEYGARASARLGPLKPARTRFERALLEGALERGLPVLGVCGGMQLLSVVRGGSLVQDIATELPGALPHEQPDDPRSPSDEVEFEPGSRLAAICGADRIAVNSTHHQAVRDPGAGMRVTARSPDGVVEAIEGTNGFVIGVQWHPELIDAQEHRAIYRALILAATER